MYRQIKEEELKKDVTLGYIYFLDSCHPLSSKASSWKVYYHRHVMSLVLDRWISSEEHVHHIDEDKSNNNPANLQIVSPKEHARLHKGYFEIVEKNCPLCGKKFEFKENLSKIFCSPKCAQKSRNKIDWPETEKLIHMTEQTSYCEVGRVLGVSDNAVRKRIKNHPPVPALPSKQLYRNRN